MKVLIACEFSGIVREAFKAKGHDAWSCDLLDTEISGQHIKGNVLEILNDGWDLMMGFPPCTYLTVTGNKWFKPEFKDRFPDREKQRKQAIGFFMKLYNAPIKKIAIENPIGIMNTIFRKPDQIIQPYFFGNKARKATCLWLKKLPRLFHNKEKDLFADKTHVSQGEIYTYKDGRTDPMWHVETMKLPKEERSKIRSLTYQGIANAMANQWG